MESYRFLPSLPLPILSFQSTTVVVDAILGDRVNPVVGASGEWEQVCHPAIVTDTCPHASATGASFFIMRALHLSVVPNFKIMYYYPTATLAEIVESTSQPNTNLPHDRS